MKRGLARPLAGIALALAVAACASAHRIDPTPGALGISILGIRPSAAGTMLDLRYRIDDSKKAAYFVDRRVHPYLIHDRTGARLGVPSGPTVGPMRQTLRAGDPPAGRVLFVLFANPGRSVQTGDTVTVVIGDYRVEHLVVE